MFLSSAAMEVVFASCCAEIVQKAALHPVDTLRARMQYNNSARSSKALVWGDMKEGFRIIASEQRPVRALYRGLAPSVVGSIPTAMVYMPTYEASKALLAGTPLSSCVGVCTGVVSACVRVPTSVVKSQLQLQLHDSTFGCLREILSRSGPAGLFVGFRATVLLDVFYAVVQFAVLEQLRWLMALLVLGNGLAVHELHPFYNAIVGFATGAVTAIATEPVDVIRTRLMAQKKGARGPAKGKAFGYGGVLDGMRQVAAKEGVASLWKGLLPRLVLKSVGSSVWYAVYMAARGIFPKGIATG